MSEPLCEFDLFQVFTTERECSILNSVLTDGNTTPSGTSTGVRFQFCKGHVLGTLFYDSECGYMLTNKCLLYVYI